MSNKPLSTATKGVRVSRAVYDRVFSRLAHRQPFAAGLDVLLGELDGKASRATIEDVRRAWGDPLIHAVPTHLGWQIQRFDGVYYYQWLGAGGVWDAGTVQGTRCILAATELDAIDAALVAAPEKT